MNELASRLRAHPQDDLSLAGGGIALGIGAALAFQRMSDSWAKLPLLLLVAIPCALLFALALAPGRSGGAVGSGQEGRLAPWQTALLLTGIGLLYFSLVQLIVVLGKDNPGTGTQTWVLLLTGLCAAAISARLHSPGALVAACFALGIAGLTTVDWIDTHAQPASYRDVLLVEGMIFLLLARWSWDANRVNARLLAALSGLALTAGAALGLKVSLLSLVGFEAGSSSEDGWVFVLVLVTVGMLAFSAWQRHGPSAIVGALGLYLFANVTARGGDLSGWPLILAIAAALCFAWALLVRPSARAPWAKGTGGGPAAPPGG